MTILTVDPKVLVTGTQYHWIWANGDTMCKKGNWQPTGMIRKYSTALKWHRSPCPGCTATVEFMKKGWK